MIPIEIVSKSPKLYSIYFNSSEAKGIPLKTFHMSDIHFDSKSCDREKLKKDLDMCLRDGRHIFIYGDLFDIMCTQSDKRRSYDLIRPEYLGEKYLNLVLDDVCEFFKPYAQNIAHISEGNHESAIRKYQSTDMLDLFYKAMKSAGSPAVLSPYTGFIGIRSYRGKDRDKKIAAKNIHYHHGHEGGRRSKGMLKVDTDQAKWEADIHISGHNHQKWSTPWAHEYIGRLTGEVKIRRGYHINLGTYKDKGESGKGWGEEKSFGCPGIGGYCIDFLRNTETLEYHVYEPAPWSSALSFKDTEDPKHERGYTKTK